jgi:hypothetical protein
MESPPKSVRFTMHVGGEFLLAAIRTSEPDVVRRFLADAEDLIVYLWGGHKRYRAVAALRSAERWMASVRDPFYLYHDIEFESDDSDDSSGEGGDPDPLSRAFVFAVLLQSVRLACVVHDIGHYPFSHATEFALRDLAYLPTTNPERRKFQKQVKDLELKHSRPLHEAVGTHHRGRVQREACRDHRSTLIGDAKPRGLAPPQYSP